MNKLLRKFIDENIEKISSRRNFVTVLTYKNNSPIEYLYMIKKVPESSIKNIHELYKNDIYKGVIFILCAAENLKGYNVVNSDFYFTYLGGYNVNYLKNKKFSYYRIEPEKRMCKNDCIYNISPIATIIDERIYNEFFRYIKKPLDKRFISLKFLELSQELPYLTEFIINNNHYELINYVKSIKKFNKHQLKMLSKISKNKVINLDDINFIKSNLTKKDYERRKYNNKLKLYKRKYSRKLIELNVNEKFIDDLIEYIVKNDININTYYDYLNDLTFFKIKFIKASLMPRSFNISHEILYKRKETKQNEMFDKEMYKISNSLGNHYTFDKFELYIPISTNELIDCGNKLENCVGRLNYNERIYKHDSLICFLKMKDIIFGCVEITNNKIAQCLGYKNESISPYFEKMINKILIPQIRTKKILNIS